MGSGSLGVLFSTGSSAGSGLVPVPLREVSAWVSAGEKALPHREVHSQCLLISPLGWGLAEWEGWRLEFSVRTLARGQQQDGAWMIAEREEPRFP